jgi:hypothetical protein
MVDATGDSSERIAERTVQIKDDAAYSVDDLELLADEFRKVRRLVIR